MGGYEVGQLRQVVTCQPELAEAIDVEGENHNASSDAPKLTHANEGVPPVVGGGDSHRDIEGPVDERQIFGSGCDTRRRVGRTLAARRIA